MHDRQRKVILGLGNLLYHDEGLGIHAMRALKDRLDAQPGLEWVGGNVLGLSLLPLVNECSHLLVLDGLDAGHPPGSPVEISRESLRLYARMRIGDHQASFQEALVMATMRGGLPPDLRLVGAQICDLSFGIGLSPPVAAVLPWMIERGTEIVQAWEAPTH